MVVADGEADVVLPALIVDAGAGCRRAVSGVLRGADREREDAGGVREGGGAVSGVVRGARSRPRGDRAAPRGRLHPYSSGIGSDRQAAPRGDPHALRLARRQPGPPSEPRRGRARPKHVVTKGSTPVLSPAEARKLLDCIDTGSLAGHRDRALVSVMLYSFARVSAVLGMRRQDYFQQGAGGGCGFTRRRGPHPAQRDRHVGRQQRGREDSRGRHPSLPQSSVWSARLHSQ